MLANTFFYIHTYTAANAKAARVTSESNGKLEISRRAMKGSLYCH